MRTGISPILVLASASWASGALRTELAISARTDPVESDWSCAFYNGTNSLLIGNDGGAASGGLRVWALSSATPLPELSHPTPGRTKLVVPVYNVSGSEQDLIVTIAQPDSLFRLYAPMGDGSGVVEQVGEPLKEVLGDWSALCAWKSPTSGEHYLFLFGKGQATQLLLRKAPKDGLFELLEVQTFETSIEASSCSVMPLAGVVYFSGDDGVDVFAFSAAESTASPVVKLLGQAQEYITGLTTYVSTTSEYLLLALESSVAVYNVSFHLLGSMTLTGDEDIEIQGLAVLQAATDEYPAGVLTYAVESDSGTGFGISSLQDAFGALGLVLNIDYDPREGPSQQRSIVCDECSLSGFCNSTCGKSASPPSCSCLAGFEGPHCASFVCREACSGHGTCVGPNTCECADGWGGLYCGFKVVRPVQETDAYGGDGDDPAIWVHPTNRAESRVITTIKSEDGAGLAVFALNGTLIQIMPGGQPNNVDVIYGFRAGNRTVDLAYAATIPGGTQPTKEDYDVYGSCVYRSRETGKQYLFVNAKSAEYLQFELKFSNGALQTSLVRSFTGGSGGQVEGCVSDEANGWIFIGEEPRALWRYGAEPDNDVSKASRVLVGQVGDGHMYADVEGVALVEGPAASQGFILVSQQGVSAYNVYRRAAPHDFIETFTIHENIEKGIDGVSNTDGIAAVGAALGDLFPRGLVVVHDDANQLAGGDTSDAASFKLVSLADVLGEELLADVDANWDPRQ